MIIYNIRKNGPYEYDKFMLNIGQIINELRDKEVELENQIQNMTEALESLDETFADIQKDADRIQLLTRSYFD